MTNTEATATTVQQLSGRMSKVLIANRGEIAVRVARAARDCHLASVAIFSDPDAESLHVAVADEAYALEGSASADTYLNIDKILEIARRSGADAVHPGYGFLSENADFARAVIEAGLTWIGPSPDAIATLGDKLSARALAVEVGAPLVPGSDGPVESADEARAFAEENGLPIAIKAAFGGGGRGMKIVHRVDDIESAYDSAVREARTAFGRGECFVERFLQRPRHVEAQVVADTHGNVVVVGTRDCSLQRRNQKLIEEAPAPWLSQEQRQRIHDSAEDICRAAGYTGAGTVEYLVAPDGLISFLEVNTRLQVEHPVTEQTTGVDLVAEQFRIAAGLPLSFTETPEPTGHSFEFRLNAEDPALGFVPSPGTVERFESPTGPGVRLDSGVVSGSVVPGEYDSMLAKLIITGANREQALIRARQALKELVITGVPTVVGFHQAVLETEDFTSTEAFGVYTTWIEDEFTPELQASPYLTHPGSARREITITLDGKAHALGLPEELYRALRHGSGGACDEDSTGQDATTERSATALTAPMNGSIVKWLVADGDQVETADPVVVVEAMKTETTLRAPMAGIFRRESFNEGDAVRRGEELGHCE